MSLDLPCFGYGTSPPEWLDGGKKQQAQAEYFKKLVKQTLAGRASQYKHHKSKRRKLFSSESTESSSKSPEPQLDIQHNTVKLIQPECLPETDIITPNLLQGNELIFDAFQQDPPAFNINIGQDLLLDGNQYCNDLQNLVDDLPLDLSGSANSTSKSMLDKFFDCPRLTMSTALTSASSGLSTRSDSQSRYSLSSVRSTSHYDVGCASWDINSAAHDRTPNCGSASLGPDDTMALRWFLDSALPINFPLMTNEVLVQVHELITTTATHSKVCMAAIRSQMIHHRLSQLESFRLSKAEHNDTAAEAEHLALMGIQDLLSSNSEPLTQVLRLDAICELCVTIAILLLSNVSCPKLVAAGHSLNTRRRSFEIRLPGHQYTTLR